MKVLSVVFNVVDQTIQVMVSYNTKTPFGNHSGTNSFQLSPEEAAAILPDKVAIHAAALAHVIAQGYVEVI